MQTGRVRTQHVHNPNLSAIILRDGGPSSPALITRLWYDGCEMASDATFDVDENIKIAISGMGCINAQVTSIAEVKLSVRFVEECTV